MTERRTGKSAQDVEARLAQIASAIAEPSRSRMLCCLLDGHARTGTELAAVADIGAPTASAHLQRMKDLGLLHLSAQGRHRYYRLAGPEVAQALEALLIVAVPAAPPFVPSTPPPLRLARTCYDHLAGELGVAWHDRLIALGWLAASANGADYLLTPRGRNALLELGMDPECSHRRRFAYACLDWSVRRPHLGGALGAGLLELAYTRGWLRRQLDSRALSLSAKGRRDFEALFGVHLDGAVGDRPGVDRDRGMPLRGNRIG